MKFAFLPLALSLVSLTVVAGCGASSNADRSADSRTDSNTATGSSTPEPSAQSVELTVSAAASLKDALGDIEREYLKARPGARLRFNFGSSGTLQRQIEAGAPVDVFIAASAKNMDALAKRGLIEKSTRRVLAGNALVLIVPLKSRAPIRGFNDVAKEVVSRVAVGGPGVPAGERAQEVFESLGVWPGVPAKAVRARDVREALAQVEAGNVEAGVVYRTDALSSRRVRVVAVAAPGGHKPIVYPVAVVSRSPSAGEARALVDFLTGARGKEALKRRGFTVR